MSITFQNKCISKDNSFYFLLMYNIQIQIYCCLYTTYFSLSRVLPHLYIWNSSIIKILCAVSPSRKPYSIFRNFFIIYCLMKKIHIRINTRIKSSLLQYVVIIFVLDFLYFFLFLYVFSKSKAIGKSNLLYIFSIL